MKEVFERAVKQALEQGARLSYGRRWLTSNAATNEYDVWGQEYHQRVRTIMSTASIAEAIACLITESKG